MFRPRSEWECGRLFLQINVDRSNFPRDSLWEKKTETSTEKQNIALCCVVSDIQSANPNVALLLPHHLPGGDTMATAFWPMNVLTGTNLVNKRQVVMRGARITGRGDDGWCTMIRWGLVLTMFGDLLDVLLDETAVTNIVWRWATRGPTRSSLRQ